MAQGDAQDLLAIVNATNTGQKAFLDDRVGEAILEHDVLIRLGQGGLNDYFLGTEPDAVSLKHLQDLWQRLLATARSLQVTDGHLTATCNAICVFLKNACSCPVSKLRQFARSRDVWTECFGTLLQCFDRGRIKPMRQVLMTLTKMLESAPGQAASETVQTEVITGMLKVVLVEKSTQTKVALIVLELLLRKAVTVASLLENVTRLLAECRATWKRRLCDHGLGDMPGSDFLACIEGSQETAKSVTASSHFVVAIFLAFLSVETQSAAVALFKTYTSALDACGRRFYLYPGSTTSNSTCVEDIKNNTARCSQLVTFLILAQPQSLKPLAEYIVPIMLQQEASTYEHLLLEMQEQKVGLAARLSILQIACEKGLEKDPMRVLSSVQKCVQGSAPHSVSKLVSLLLSHVDEEVRLSTLKLLLTSSSTTAPLSKSILECLLSNLKYIYCDNDAHNRGEILSILRRLLIRLHGSSFSIAREVSPEPHKSSNPTMGTAYASEVKKFLVEFLYFLESELAPSCSYSRHTLALKSLELFIRSGVDPWVDDSSAVIPEQIPWPLQISLQRMPLISSLFDLVMNSYEDVRATASTILKMCLPSFHSHQPQYLEKVLQDIDVLLVHTTKIATTSNRADHADGYARLFELYYTRLPITSESRRSHDPIPCPNSGFHFLDINVLSLENRLRPLASSTHAGDEPKRLHKLYAIETTPLSSDETPASPGKQEIEGFTSLEKPYTGLPLHGILLGLHYCLQDPDLFAQPAQALIRRILHICWMVWKSLKSRICIDSPETTNEDTDDDLVAAPRDMLAYSWRAVRDSCLLLRVLLESPYFTDRTLVDGAKLCDYKLVSSLCIAQLTELRHRGAFSTVAKTYVVLAQRVSEANDPQISDMRSLWYRNAREQIDLQAMKLTRRSGGLPALMVGILTSCSPSFFALYLDDAIASLVHIPNCSPLGNAHEEHRPEVHQLNCLRAVFTDSKFRALTTPHVFKVLRIAASCLSCEIWAIRNCGLMLFRACTLRLGESTTSERSCDLIDLAADLHQPGSSTEADLAGAQRCEIQSSADSRDYQSFAALELLGRVGVSTEKQKLVDSILLYEMGNKVWQLRDQAARTFASRLSTDFALTAVHSLIVSMTGCGQNGMHGRLVCLRYICNNLTPGSHIDQCLLIALLEPLQSIALDQQWAPSIRSLAFSICNKMRLATDSRERAASKGITATTPRHPNHIGLQDPQFDLPPKDHEQPQVRDLPNLLQVPEPTIRFQVLSRIFRSVREATVDELDLQSRIDAAEALLEVAQNRQISKITTAHSTQHLFDLCIGLYDLLNDDDQEVRLIAASASSAMLDRDDYDNNLIRCPLAASEDILSLLDKHFDTKPLLVKEALSRIIRPGPHSGCCFTMLDVSAQLRQVQADANDLFAEERQNLYIDDVREVCAWSALLKRHQQPVAEDLRILAMQIESGLDELAKYLQGKLEFDCPHNATSNPDVLTIFLRAIKLAGVVMHWGALTHHGICKRLLKSLHHLQSVGVVEGVHDILSRSIDEALRENRIYSRPTTRDGVTTREQ